MLYFINDEGEYESCECALCSRENIHEELVDELIDLGWDVKDLLNDDVVLIYEDIASLVSVELYLYERADQEGKELDDEWYVLFQAFKQHVDFVVKPASSRHYNLRNGP